MLRILPKILLVLIFFSKAALASDNFKEVNSQQISCLHKVGSVSVSGVRGSLDDALRTLQLQVNDGYYYKVIALGTAGDSSLWRVTAIIYK